MIIVKPSCHILAMSGKKDTEFSYEDSEKLIEYAGRICYGTLDKRTSDSYIRFNENLRQRGHLSVLEHSWEIRNYQFVESAKAFVEKNPLLNRYFSLVAGNKRMFDEAEAKTAITNYTAVSRTENLPEEMKCLTVHIVCDRGTAFQLDRHRIASFSEESTRYNAYKNHVCFVAPHWWTNDSLLYKEILPSPDLQSKDYDPRTYNWLCDMLTMELMYHWALRREAPEDARDRLGSALKIEMVVSMNWKEWKHVFDQRVFGKTGRPHPNMVNTLKFLYESLSKMEEYFHE